MRRVVSGPAPPPPFPLLAGSRLLSPAAAFSPASQASSPAPGVLSPPLKPPSSSPRPLLSPCPGQCSAAPTPPPSRSDSDGIFRAASVLSCGFRSPAAGTGSHRGENAPAGPGPRPRRSSPFLLIVVEYAAELTLFSFVGWQPDCSARLFGRWPFRLSEILRDAGLRPTLAQGGGSAFSFEGSLWKRV